MSSILVDWRGTLRFYKIICRMSFRDFVFQFAPRANDRSRKYRVTLKISDVNETYSYALTLNYLNREISASFSRAKSIYSVVNISRSAVSPLRREAITALPWKKPSPTTGRFSLVISPEVEHSGCGDSDFRAHHARWRGIEKASEQARTKEKKIKESSQWQNEE